MDTFLEFCEWFGEFSMWAGFIITLLIVIVTLLGGLAQMVKKGFKALDFLVFGAMFFVAVILCIIIGTGGFHLY